MNILLKTLYGIAIAVVIAGVGFCLHQLRRALVADRFLIPSESMEPTLVAGDAVWVNKLLMGARIYTDLEFSKKGVQLQSVRTRGLRAIRHNDIVVFNRANHRGKIKFIINYVYCKRVVGLPGDTVSVAGGYYRNNNYSGLLGVKSRQDMLARTPESGIERMCRRVMLHKDTERWTIHDFGPLYIPRKGDVVDITPKEAIAYKAMLEWETEKEIRVDTVSKMVTAGGKPFGRHRFRHNYYFMAGDNVMNSQDSRYFGVVPEEYIVGIVGKISKGVNKKGK